MFAKTLAALKTVEAAAAEELEALWVPFDEKTGTGAVYWNAQGAGTLTDLLRGVRGLISEIEPKQAAHDAAQAEAQAAEAAAAAASQPAEEPVTEPTTEPVTEAPTETAEPVTEPAAEA